MNSLMGCTAVSIDKYEPINGDKVYSIIFHT